MALMIITSGGIYNGLEKHKRRYTTTGQATRCYHRDRKADTVNIKQGIVLASRQVNVCLLRSYVVEIGSMTGRPPKIRKVPRDLTRQHIHLELAREECKDAYNAYHEARQRLEKALDHKRRVKQQFISTERLRYLV